MPSTRGHRGITVVIAFRGKDYLARLRNCLRSLVRQTLPPQEIIVSEQDTAGIASGICEEVGATHLITATRPMFNKSAALNVGLKYAQTEHIYTMDADVILSPKALEEVHARVQVGKFVMLDAQRAGVDGPASWERAYSKSWKVDWARVCFGILNGTTRKVWFRIKGFDESFVGWGSEDTFVAWKTEFLGIPHEWVPNVSVHQEHPGEKAYRAEADLNARRLQSLKARPFCPRWGEDIVLHRVVRPPLLVDVRALPITVLITTYNRPSVLLDLLRDLSLEAGTHSLQVHVFDDCSTEDYGPVRKFLKQSKWHYYRAERNHGKVRYWEWINKIFEVAKKTPSTTFLQIPDDVRLCERFFDRLLYIWRSIPDNSRVTLNPLKDALRADQACWTGRPPVKGKLADRVDWVDMCYLAERRFFEELGWRIHPIPPLPAWIGSGVGSQISRRLHEKGLTMYRTKDSHVVHVVGESKMNCEIRLSESMRVKDFVDGAEVARSKEISGEVVAALASIPERVEALERVVQSLLPQVDRVCVYLNGYNTVPRFLERERIEVVLSLEEGDLGDAGKFWWCSRVHGYYLTCDDDLIYPPDYVDRLVLHLETFRRKAVVGFHGAILQEPLHSYYSSRTVFPCLGSLESRTGVHVLGTGAMGYHTDTIRVSIDDFPAPNMADVWFARLGQEQQIPFAVIPHKTGWIQHIPHKDTIYSRSRGKDALQTQAVQEKRPWKVFPL